MPQAKSVPTSKPKDRAMAPPSREAMIASIATRLRGLDIEKLEQLAIALSVGKPASAPDRSPKILKGAGLGAILSAAEGRSALDDVTIEHTSPDWAASELLGAGGIAARLKIAPATLTNWRQAKRVIAFRKGPRNYLYPLRQFDRFGPIEGLDRVAPFFATSEDAWEWLVTPNRSTRSQAPLDRLKARQVAEVVRAAEGALDFG